MIIKGKIVKGDGRGKKQGYPTANLDRRAFRRRYPPRGVWACGIKVKNQKSKVKSSGSWLKGVAVIGVDNKVEVHIFDFDKNIYGWYGEIELVKRLRSLREYRDTRLLIAQIKRDIIEAKKILK